MAKATDSEQASPLADLTRMLEQFKVPGVDMGAIVESRRKDVEALAAANQAALESMQGLASKQSEILAHAFKGVQDGFQSMVTSGVAPDHVRNAEIARKAYERAVTDMRELGEMARKAQTDAMAGVSARAQEKVQEMKRLMQPR